MQLYHCSYFYDEHRYNTREYIVCVNICFKSVPTDATEPTVPTVAYFAKLRIDISERGKLISLIAEAMEPITKRV